MGWINTLFSTSTIDSAVDAVINTGDKLVYTDEEKADMKLLTGKLHINMLKAYEPFKIAQRVLALWFSLLYGSAFIIGLAIAVFNMITTYKQTVAGIKVNDIVLISLDPLFNLVSAFSVGIIMATIIVFYFGGGTIESMRNIKK